MCDVKYLKEGRSQIISLAIRIITSNRFKVITAEMYCGMCYSTDKVVNMKLIGQSVRAIKCILCLIDECN